MEMQFKFSYLRLRAFSSVVCEADLIVPFGSSGSLPKILNGSVLYL